MTKNTLSVLSKEVVPSPCVRVCTLKASVCVGCGRTISEISEWSSADEQRKKQIINSSFFRMGLHTNKKIEDGQR